MNAAPARLRQLCRPVAAPSARSGIAQGKHPNFAPVQGRERLSQSPPSLNPAYPCQTPRKNRGDKSSAVGLSTLSPPGRLWAVLVRQGLPAKSSDPMEIYQKAVRQGKAASGRRLQFKCGQLRYRAAAVPSFMLGAAQLSSTGNRHGFHAPLPFSVISPSFRKAEPQTSLTA